ncbi:MAG: hypothetical protein JW940_04975 [Polyangiaceae bacterium]|nr:hypothetical protein [Polyangiaceae bacterium]
MALAIERANHLLLGLSLTARALSWLCVGTLLVACSDQGDDDDDDAGSTNVMLTDENNYQSTTKLTLDTVKVAVDEEIEVCWDQVTTDLLGHEVDPTKDIDHIQLIRFKGQSEDDVETRLASGTLKAGDLDGLFEYTVADHANTCVDLSNLHGLGDTDGHIDLQDEFVASDDFTYVLLVAEGTTPGVGTQSMVFLKRSSSADATTVEVPEGGNILEYSATLSSQKVSIPADGPWVIDWSKLKHDGTGNGIGSTDIDSVLLGFYEDMAVKDVQSQIKDMEIIATTLWEAEDPRNKQQDLAEAKERKSGDAFPGFESTNGVWLLGLMCSSCQSPAPLGLAVLDPQAGE